MRLNGYNFALGVGVDSAYDDNINYDPSSKILLYLLVIQPEKCCGARVHPEEFGWSTSRIVRGIAFFWYSMLIHTI